MKRDTSSLFDHLAAVQTALNVEIEKETALDGLSGGAFLELDPVLMQLAKQRKQAQSDYKRLSKDGLFGEAMAEVAAAQVAHLQRLYAERLALLQSQRKSVLNRDRKKYLEQRCEEVAIQKRVAAAQVAMEQEIDKKKAQDKRNEWWLLVVLYMMFSKSFDAPRLTPT